ncbi:hypothetical protein ACFPRL_29680 [Pseudoclavibacter helvolus]
MHALGCHEPDDALHHGLRLAAAGTGHDEARYRRCLDHEPLLRCRFEHPRWVVVGERQRDIAVGHGSCRPAVRHSVTSGAACSAHARPPPKEPRQWDSRWAW